MKTCIKCQQTKEITQFEKERNVCKKCRYINKRAKSPRYFEITLIEKICSCCKILKLKDEFHIEHNRPGGLRAYCKPCDKIKQQIKYEKNKEMRKAKSAERYAKIRCTEAINAPARKRRAHKTKTDPKYKLKRKLRNRLYYALKKKSWKKNTHFAEYIGCSLDELKIHLENKFMSNMTWDNHGEWHIDHIIPLDSAQSDEELYKLCHYTNLQPLWAIDNIKKANKI